MMTDPAPEIPLPLPTDYVLDDPQHVAHHNKLSFEFNRMSASVIHEGSIRWDLSKHDVPTDGTTLADTAFDALLAQMKPGDTLDIPHGASIKLANRRDITKPITIEGNGATIIQSSTAGVFRVLAGGGGSRFKSLTGVGPSGTTYAADSKFILLSGTLGAYVEDVTLDNVTGRQWGNGTLWAEYARRITTRDVLTQSCMYVGQMFISCEYVTLFNPMCDTLQGLAGNANSYPVAFTRNSAQSIVNSPRSHTCRVFGGWATNTTWESLDTHGGVDIKVFGYKSFNTKIGISFVNSPDAGGVATYAPVDCWAFGCESSSSVSDGSYGDGFILQGAFGVEQATGGFVGCTAIGHGNADSTSGSGGIRLVATDSVAVSNYRAVACSPHGVALVGDNYDAVLSDIVATDPWANSTVTGVIGMTSNNNTFTLSDARLHRGSKSTAYVARGGIWANSGTATGNRITLGGGNDFTGAVDGPFVNCQAWLRQAFYAGDPVAKPSLPSAGAVTAADIRTALIGLGLAQ